jgi:hypothetical protein
LYKDNFQQALLRYEQTAPEKAKTYIKVLSTHTWDDVLNLVDGALASYQDTSGPCGKIKKMLRKLGSQTDMLMAWSNLLPSQSEYFSLLCGGLKIIITVRASTVSVCPPTILTYHRPQLDFATSAMNSQQHLKNYQVYSRVSMAH